MKAVTSKNATGPAGAAGDEQADDALAGEPARRPLRDLMGDGLLDRP